MERVIFLNVFFFSLLLSPLGWANHVATKVIQCHPADIGSHLKASVYGVLQITKTEGPFYPATAKGTLRISFTDEGNINQSRVEEALFTGKYRFIPPSDFHGPIEDAELVPAKNSDILVAEINFLETDSSAVVLKNGERYLSSCVTGTIWKEHLPGRYLAKMDHYGVIYEFELTLLRDGRAWLREIYANGQMPEPGCEGRYRFERGVLFGEYDCKGWQDRGRVTQEIYFRKVLEKDFLSMHPIPVKIKTSGVLGNEPIWFKIQRRGSPPPG